MKTKNEIIIKDGYAEIVLHNKKGDEKGKAKVDIDKLPILKKYRWYLDGNGYVCATSDKQIIKLSRFLLGLTDSKLYVDHINGEPLDNRMINLRAVTPQQNAMNHKNLKTNKVGMSGVYWEKQAKMWRVRIVANKKKIHIGYYKDLDKAITARLEAEKEYYGNFRRFKDEQLKFEFLDFKIY